MKNIAIVTGASSGMGKEFTLTIPQNISVDEIWAIALDQKLLEELQGQMNIPVRIFKLDLEKEENIQKIAKELNKEKPNVKLLINASGYGKFEATKNIPLDDNLGMIKLNAQGLTHMCLICLPYMEKESSIINFASVAAFQPVPYINVYAATKAYVLSFSRSLYSELKKDGIHVMAVCPYWTKTAFFKRAVTKDAVIKKYICMYNAEDVIKRAWRDLSKKKDVSKYGFIARGQVALCKIIPHKMVMKVWMKQQKLK